MREYHDGANALCVPAVPTASQKSMSDELKATLDALEGALKEIMTGEVVGSKSSQGTHFAGSAH